MKKGWPFPLTPFSSLIGPEVQASLLGIQQSFVESLKMLREIHNEILDVKSNLWLDRFNKFKQTTKDLEVSVPVSYIYIYLGREGEKKMIDVFCV